MIGRIYKITNTKNRKFYIGSTITSIADRLAKHKHKSKDPDKTSKLYSLMRELGQEHFRIELLREVEVRNRTELEVIEKRYIHRLHALSSLNHTHFV
jgi:group I intron endonuclease